MERVRPWRGQPLDRGSLKNRYPCEHGSNGCLSIFVMRLFRKRVFGDGDIIAVRVCDRLVSWTSLLQSSSGESTSLSSALKNEVPAVVCCLLVFVKFNN